MGVFFMKTNFAIECLCRTEKTPDNPAIYSVERGTFSYQWLWEQAKRFGNVLHGLGVNKGDRYACVLPNIPEAAVVFLGGQLIGSVPVMVFIGYKEKEFEHIFRISGAKVIVTTAEHRKKVEGATLEGGPKQILVIDEATEELPSFSQLMSEGSDDLNPVVNEADEIAEIMFTSGTSGTPKGVPHTHSNMMRQCEFMRSVSWGGLGPGDVIYTQAPIGFAIGLHCHIHFPFYSGACSVYCTERVSPERFLELVKKYRVTHIITTATHLWKVLSVPPQPQCMKTVKSLAVGGSAVTKSLFGKWCEAYRGILPRASLSMTELFGSALGIAIGEGRPDTVGKLWPGWEARIVDAADPQGQKEVQRGETGVLWLKGPSVLPYYWNDKKLTDEKLRDGWFKTDDLVYEDEEGYFHHVGRLDELIKSSGWRVSPVEIENVLREHHSIEDVAVVGISSQIKGQEIVAVIVPSQPVADEGSLFEELKTFVRERLAGYKVPGRFVLKESLPRTATGKVQRKQLSEELSRLVEE
jgi:acyl-coenzyme A synthetase/AMP-(fatty) acid ligase